MRLQLKGAYVYSDGAFTRRNLEIADGVIIDAAECKDDSTDCETFFVLPGLADVHVHLREPGFSYKETISTGTAAAARGGFTAVCTMPNVDPPPDRSENLRVQLEIIARDALIPVKPYACITKGGTGTGEPVDFMSLTKFAVAFSDDGRGVQARDTMLRAMSEAAMNNALIAAHCEDDKLKGTGCIHDGVYAKNNGITGITSKSEWTQVKRDLELAEETGCAYHVCHVSTAESVELIREAKRRGVDVTCETAVHYLVFSDEELIDDGRFKMNPPLRSPADRAALIRAVADGTIDMLASDHAPHSPEEKSKGLAGSSFGVVGLEVALPAAHTALVKTGLITMEHLVELMCTNPRRRFKLGSSEIKQGHMADLCVFYPDREWVVDSSEFISKGRATPFNGTRLYGQVTLTISDGRIVYDA